VVRAASKKNQAIAAHSELLEQAVTLSNHSGAGNIKLHTASDQGLM